MTLNVTQGTHNRVTLTVANGTLNIGTVSAGDAARLLADDGNTRLYFSPAANFNGTVANALTIRGWDRTTGTNGATASTTTNGGTTAFSTATDVVTVTVTPVQDPPVARNDTLPVNGSLTFRGSPVVAGLVIAFADIGDLVFRPGPNENGTNYASFGFSVRDNTGLFAPTPSAMTLNVTPVNNAPVALGESGNTPEDTPLAFTTAALLANDTDADGDGDTLTIAAVSPASANGGAVSLVGGNVTYTPAANFTGTDTFTYTVSDGNGGTAIATVSVVATPVNDAPASTDTARTLGEDTVYRFTGAQFAFADPDTGDALAAVRIDSLPARGSLALDGVAVTAGQVIAATDLTRLTFTPGANDNGTGYAAFTFSVSDGVLFVTAPNTVTFNVDPINDPPVAADRALGTTFNRPVSGRLTGTDVDNDPLTFSLQGAPANGTAIVNADGTFTYRPATGFVGTDTFIYRVSDGAGGVVDRTERIVATRSIVRAGEIESATLSEARTTGPGVFVLPAVAAIEAEVAVASANARTASSPFATGAEPDRPRDMAPTEACRPRSGVARRRVHRRSPRNFAPRQSIAAPIHPPPPCRTPIATPRA